MEFKFVEMFSVRTDEIEIRPGGSHCDVAIITKDGSNRFIKVIGGKKGHMTRDEAENMATNIEMYNQVLHDVGVPVAQSCEVRFLYDEDEGDYKILHIAPYLGHDAEYWLRQKREVMRETVAHLIEPVRSILSHTLRGTEVSVGFDPKPANFARIRGGTRFSFIDTMPPRFRKGRQTLVEYPEPKSPVGKSLAYFRFFDQRGILHVLFVQLCRLRPLQRPFFFKKIAEVARDFNVEQYFLESPAARFARSNPKHRLQIIEQLEASDMYWLRDIACHLCWENLLNQRALDEFFRLTHFNDGLPDQTVEAAQKKLIEITGS